MKSVKVNSILTKFNNIQVYTQSMKVKDVLSIYYVAVRGQDDEPGAVQRVLNRQRINSIKQYLLEGNIFFSTFLLNWTDQKVKPVFGEGILNIPIIASAAQVIDGQHRLGGLQEAVKENPKIGDKEILVTFSLHLSTKQAAQIFININSEQKPVPKSLIYDLFGEIEEDGEHAVNRATDIASEFNENPESPFYGCVKYPGKPRGMGLIDLSTIVSSLRKHLDRDGIFASHKLTNLQNQKQVLLNYFTAVKHFYDQQDIWEDRNKNPFLTNAGFFGAIEHLVKNLLLKCAEKKSFKTHDFITLLNFSDSDLLLKSDLKNLEGKSQRKAVLDYLEKHFHSLLPDQEEYEF